MKTSFFTLTATYLTPHSEDSGERNGFIMLWELTNDRPLYIQLMEQIKLLILSGEYEAGQPFPSVRELALAANVNPNTMQRALVELERAGLLINERTNGRRITSDVSMIQSMRDELALHKLCQLKTELNHLGYDKEEQLSFVTSKWDMCPTNQ